MLQENEVFLLIDEVIKGNTDAFNKLYNEYKLFLKKYIHSTKIKQQISIRTEDIEDLIQDIWIKVFFNISKFKMDSKFHTWLGAIAKNQLSNYKMKNKRTNRYFHRISSL